MVEEACQPRPGTECLARGLSRSALGQHRLAYRQDVSADLVESWFSFLLPESIAAGMI